jgi:hypothetical protein
MRLCRSFWLIGGICLAQFAFAQCPHVSHEAGDAESHTVPASTTSAGEQREVEDRTVLLKLVLSKSGRVREATVLRGPAALAPAAIEAAKRGKYKHLIVYRSPDTGETMVAVTFREDNKGAPQIRQALAAGVSGCVYPERVDPPPWLNLFLSERRPIPVLAPETKK